MTASNFVPSSHVVASATHFLVTASNVVPSSHVVASATQTSAKRTVPAPQARAAVGLGVGLGEVDGDSVGSEVVSDVLGLKVELSGSGSGLQGHACC